MKSNVLAPWSRYTLIKYSVSVVTRDTFGYWYRLMLLDSINKISIYDVVEIGLLADNYITFHILYYRTNRPKPMCSDKANTEKHNKETRRNK